MKYTFKSYLIAIALLLGSLSAAYAQRTFNFEIDGAKYSLDEAKYNDLFGITFSKLVAKGVAKESAFDAWVTTFNGFKVFSVKGYYRYTTYGERLATSQYSGDNMPLYFLGWEKEGKLSKANPNNPTKPESIAARMAVLNHYLGREVVRYLTDKPILD
ncbi:hypothetical protein [Mucilaginibacter sp. HD30]